ncbi:hypothetical protein SAMN05428949_0222 [Chitinophaga sp. YR627]|uniref:hypothetical protein n=1 Tax=Chitinophaga sp. YR627 TaxID=1881041 RepID=UPI0008DEE58F|nr:hypothetical protein [Chitinophaga sp. YR627]SFM62674.1 hypothetical protein SAMN05428949_0222 [Chitinophaga sp. YR627]
MKTLHYKHIIFLTLTLLTASCKEIRSSFEETIHPVAGKKEKSPVGSSSSSTVTFSSSSVFSAVSEQEFSSIFEDAAKLDSIQQALYEMPHLKGKELFFLAGLYFYDYQGGMISVDLQDPDKPENVDTYTYSNGHWEIQKPVKISTNTHFPLKMLLMPLHDIKFSTAKKVYDIAMEKSKDIEGAEGTQHVYFTQMKAVHVTEWYVIIPAARRNYRMTFDIAGNLRSTGS